MCLLIYAVVGSLSFNWSNIFVSFSEHKIHSRFSCLVKIHIAALTVYKPPWTSANTAVKKKCCNHESCKRRNVNLFLSLISKFVSEPNHHVKQAFSFFFFLLYCVSTPFITFVSDSTFLFSFQEQTAERNDNLTSLKMYSDSWASEASISK